VSAQPNVRVRNCAGAFNFQQAYIVVASLSSSGHALGNVMEALTCCDR
jgi:hypothetical protein